MKAVRTSITAIIAATILVVPVWISIHQQVNATDAADYVLWRKTTHDFEKAVIDAAIGNPNEGPAPHLIPGLLQDYVDDVNRIFLGGPDTIPELLEQYQQAVLRVFTAPPEPDKPQQHDQVKEFRQLTNAFEKALRCVIIQPCI